MLVPVDITVRRLPMAKALRFRRLLPLTAEATVEAVPHARETIERGIILVLRMVVAKARVIGGPESLTKQKRSRSGHFLRGVPSASLEELSKTPWPWHCFLLLLHMRLAVAVLFRVRFT